MQNSPNRTAPREYNDRRGSGPHYPKYYDADGQNINQRPPTRNPRTMDIPIQDHRRASLTEQYSPTNTNNPSSARGVSHDMSRPPTYDGPQYEDPVLQQQVQQPKRRGYRRTDSEEVQYRDQNTVPQSSTGRAVQIQNSRAEASPNQSMPMARDQRHGSPPKNHSPHRSSGPESPEPVISTARAASIQIQNAAAGASIQRLESPRIMTSVLQPLDGKVKEYSSRMQNAQAQMAQLDAEMAALMERKKQSEKRFLEAKTKHDDYRRQYQGVERALRGEPADLVTRINYESDEDESPSRQQTIQLPNRQQQIRGSNSRSESWSSVKKPNTKSGSRFSVSKLFGAS
ncbi:uncharacterized protein L3040_007527 [Drepanopeziza brunnea f. sp. 'multigermtubi']|uniref:Uncharacterized protein n=1 Tax=Marssonina brunnea f. sp. multigermtubi (strain MB_m1) TaxID=1072389 RepID=K1Y004_MARBU|nr:uncharacterized protein MBM_03442 [Drepanopeziza brunnea f. sp. 'multigermtubi' MB_m1]EKD18449.1 hypothetical protein MBM_03442 [Drepanopeziza brunnea f. sp. 'multigermtubi' MB_m1]KAJ5037351.1 hypothetical protein L3040_007527 [Drepanopeziza brunnea f. sp. 'multigermtubi']